MSDSKNPYSQYPDRNFWRRTVSNAPWTKVFQHEKGRFSISPTDKVVTAGSCFAQRISRVLKEAGFNFAEFERPHPLIQPSKATELGYGQFSARYGNIYTPRQLRQLIDQAFNVIEPVYEFATSLQGTIIDLLRPNINKVGFTSTLEARHDRDYHLACVREMFTHADVFIFTLGLTESWIGETSGVVYGTHPNVVSNDVLRENVLPVNFDYADSFNDMVYIVHFLHKINPKLRYIFTVSPVALVATHQDGHVLLSTMYSKSVLRSVAGKLAQAWPAADYFFSYEIFNAAQSFGQFLADDLRDVNPRGVSFTMECFKQMYMGEMPQPARSEAEATNVIPIGKDQGAADVECDELLNELFSRAAR